MIDPGFYLGDCLEIMEKVDNESIDMILTDPPYGTTNIDWDTPIPFEPLWRQYERIIKRNGAIILFSAQPFTTDLINSNRKLFRYEIIWEKTQKMGFLSANRMPLKAHENILLFYKKQPVYNPQKSKADTKKTVGRVRIKSADRAKHYGHVNQQSYVEDGTRYPTDVVKFSNWNGALFGKTENASQHHTQKPVNLLEYLIKTYTNIGDLVLDSCAGSASTGVACHRTGRRFIGIEKNKEIYALAKKRLDAEMAQMTIFDIIKNDK